MREADRAELTKEIASLEVTTCVNQTTPWQNANVVKGICMLSRSVIRLDESIEKLDLTSTRLAKANIGVGALLAVIALLQTVVMLRGH